MSNARCLVLCLVLVSGCFDGHTHVDTSSYTGSDAGQDARVPNERDAGHDAAPPPCTQDECADEATRLRCESDGSVTTLACEANQTCYDGACTGVCRAGTGRCMAGERAAQSCTSKGEWAAVEACGGDPQKQSSWEVCRKGACVDAAAHDVGWSDAESWGTTLQLSNDMWRAVAFMVDEDVRVQALDVILASVPSKGAGSVRLSLWDDEPNGLLGAQPGKLIARTGTHSSVEGVNELGLLENQRPTLLTGTRYWLAVNVAGGVTEIYRRAAQNPEAVADAPFGDDPALTLQTFPVAPTENTSEYGLYVRAKSLR
ncbi:MAG TPA: hypothetical protein VHM19_22285 [Polyangiales bacterium]|nr:hypothetical protein [Polyangiales bacterium]